MAIIGVFLFYGEMEDKKEDEKRTSYNNGYYDSVENLFRNKVVAEVNGVELVEKDFLDHHEFYYDIDIPSTYQYKAGAYAFVQRLFMLTN